MEKMSISQFGGHMMEILDMLESQSITIEPRKSR